MQYWAKNFVLGNSKQQRANNKNEYTKELN